MNYGVGEDIEGWTGGGGLGGLGGLGGRVSPLPVDYRRIQGLIVLGGSDTSQILPCVHNSLSFSSTQYLSSRVHLHVH